MSPTYTFWCPVCDKEFVANKTVKEYERGVECPTCGYAYPQRMFYKDITSFRLDGDGWTK